MPSQPLAVIFDLDGTLIDSRPGITASLKLALEDAGQEQCLTPDQVPIGPPLADLVKSLTGSSDQCLINFIVDRFVAHYDSTGYKQSTLFDCVHCLLEELRSISASLYIATNKRLSPTLKILDHLLISRFFNDVYALDSCPGGYQSKSDMLKSMTHHCTLDIHTVYVGDRYEDYKAAVDNSLAFRFPFWGYEQDRHLFPANVIGLDLNCNMNIDFVSWLSPGCVTS